MDFGARGHDILEDHHVFLAHILPDGDDGAVGRLSVQEELAAESLQLGDDIVT